MCTTCGCGESEILTHAHAPDHEAAHGHPHAHDHDHGHKHEYEHKHEYGDHHHPHEHLLAPPGHHHDTRRRVRLEHDILAENNKFAVMNRQRFAEHGVFVLNLVSSPGSGKTALLSRTVQALRDEFPVAVIGGDQQTAHDAERILAAGAPAVQINTGKGCHLDAHGIGHALERLPLPEGGVLFIENVGNLVCPADFDLGEACKVAILSVTEGEDKPLKYPNMFAASSVMLLNKIDLLPYLDFDVPRCLDYARRVHADMHILQLSARSGAGLEAWLAWIRQGQRQALAQQISLLEVNLAAARARLVPDSATKHRAVV